MPTIDFERWLGNSPWRVSDPVSANQNTGKMEGWLGRGAFQVGTTTPAVTNYSQSVSGATSPAAVLIKLTAAHPVGAITPAGASIKATSKTFSGTMTTAGTLLTSFGKLLAAVLDFAGDITTQKIAAVFRDYWIGMNPLRVLNPVLKVQNTGTMDGWLGDGEYRVATSQTATGGSIDKTVAGILSFAATVAKGTATFWTGAFFPSGAALKDTGKPLAGSATPSGAMLKDTNKIIAAVLSFSASVQAAFNKFISGIVTFAGTVNKSTARAFTATLTSSSTVRKNTGKFFSGLVVPVGTDNKTTTKTFLGVVASVGTLVNNAGKIVAGAFTPSGAFSANLAFQKALTGVLDFSGSLLRSLVVALFGDVDFSGLISRLTDKPLAGSIVPTAPLSKNTARALSGSTTFSSVVTGAKGVAKFLVGVLQTSGTVARNTGKTLVSFIVPAGGLSEGKTLFRAFTGLIVPTAQVSKQTILTPNRMSGLFEFAGALEKDTLKAFTAVITLTGAMQKRTSKTFTAVIGWFGTVSTNFIPPTVAGIKKMFRGMFRGMKRGE